MKVVFIGAGNLATRLSLEMQRKGFEIVQIFSQTTTSAAALAGKLSCPFTTDCQQIAADADLYLFAVKDTVLPELIRSVAPNNGLWAHTAGSVPMNIFETHARRYGVFYPLQTFSKTKEVDFSVIPVFIEADNKHDLNILHQAAERLSQRVIPATSEQRQYLHLAAVFANNFTNHLFAIAQRLLEQHQLPFDALLPLIDETAAKIHTIPPIDAQTGPAVRYDRNVMDKQLELLDSDNLKNIYNDLSKSIYHFCEERKNTTDHEQNK